MRREADQTLAAAFIESDPDQAAALIEAAPPNEAGAVLADCSAAVAARVLERMLPGAAGRCVEHWPGQGLPELLAALNPEKASKVLRTIDPAKRSRVLADAPPEVVARLEHPLRFPENTVGALMDPTAFALPEDLTAGEAQRRIRGATHPLRYYLYAVDRDGQLVGVVSLRELLLTPTKRTVKEIARPTTDHLSAWASIDSAAGHPAWTQFRALPVVDEHKALLGVLGIESIPRAASPGLETASPGALGIELVHLYWLATGAVLGSLFPAETTPRSREGTDHEA